MDFFRFLVSFWDHFWSKLGCENDEKRCVLLCFRDLGDSKIDPKIVAGKKASKWLPGAHPAAQRGVKSLIASARRNARGCRGVSFQKISFGRKQRRKPTEGCEQGGVQKVECKRHIQKDKCRQGTHTGLKHARWPAATCGFIARARIPPGHVFVCVGLWGCGFVCLGRREKVNKSKGGEKETDAWYHTPWAKYHLCWWIFAAKFHQPLYLNLLYPRYENLYEN